MSSLSRRIVGLPAIRVVNKQPPRKIGMVLKGKAVQECNDWLVHTRIWPCILREGRRKHVHLGRNPYGLPCRPKEHDLVAADELNVCCTIKDSFHGRNGQLSQQCVIANLFNNSPVDDPSALIIDQRTD
jgi:hypothetical protein